MLLLILQIASVYLPIMKSEEPPRNEVYEVGRYLMENQYAVAYANFENANTITVLTDGAVRTAAVSSVAKMDVCKWLSSSDWYVPYVPYESRTAYVITETEKESFEIFYDRHHEEIQFDTQIGKFLIYVSDYNFSCVE